ncbi:MAG: T9SS type A sorting domain-containing protein [Melioribacteraceae bacterium]|jgi:hypothetical protein|nr:T9SS type A sorting domain-containing protein [Melioribacteraceae bacterium]
MLGNLTRILYRYRVDIDSSWSDINVLYYSAYCQNPQFFETISDSQQPLGISFETIVDGKTKILYYNFLSEYGNNSLALEYYNNSEVETSNFSSYLADTGISWGPAFMSVPNSAKMIRNDSTFILVPTEYMGFETYDEVPVKYSNSKHRLGNLGFRSMFDITYTIWEDSSSNGKINLFGKGRYETVVGVDDENIIPIKFNLEQNYPNPFNPSTTIKYSIPSKNVIPNPQMGEESSEISSSDRNDNVKLVVYDILGREVATLVNKEQSPGNYSVQFDASYLTSGIYFSRLQSGSFVDTKKMVLLQ